LHDRLGAFLRPLLRHPAVYTGIVNEKEPGLANVGEGDDSSMLGQPPSLTDVSAPQDGVKDSDAEILAIYTTAEDDQTHVHLKRHPNDLIMEEMLFDEEGNQQHLNMERNDEMTIKLMPSASLALSIAH
jgi:hypothetical protein